MESSESETEFSFVAPNGYAKDIDGGSTSSNLQSSDSGVSSTSSEASSCEDFSRSSFDNESCARRQFPAALLQTLLPWTQKASSTFPQGRSDSSRSIDKVGGTLALIQYSRPPNLPVKSLAEERDHKKQYDAILEQARKREILEERARRNCRQERLKREEKLVSNSEIWSTTILPKFERLRDTKKVRDLWWRGLPPSIRGKVWKLGIANDLSLSSEHYNICLENVSTDGATDESIMAIKLDVSRTFSNLGVFQEGGPLHETLRNVLAAYTVYRREIGYVQGMSFVGAILALNMEPEDAFICFANLLNKPCHSAAFTLDQKKMNAYYRVFSSALAHKIPKIHAHFDRTGLSPDLYLLDWLYTVYAKAMPLDVVCRVWDVFVRDGDEFLFRTALGILRMFQHELLSMDFVRCSQFLTKLPENLEASVLFDNIGKMTTSISSRTFQDMISEQS